MTTAEVARLEAALKKSELKIQGLERGLEQKVKSLSVLLWGVTKAHFLHKNFYLCLGFTAQSTQWGHVKCGQFT